MKYYYLIFILLFFTGCMDVREFEGKSFLVREIRKAAVEGNCSYEIISNNLISPNIIYFDKCGKWNVGDKVHFVKD